MGLNSSIAIMLNEPDQTLHAPEYRIRMSTNMKLRNVDIHSIGIIGWVFSYNASASLLSHLSHCALVPPTSSQGSPTQTP